MRRSALPLPRYVERKPLKGGGWGYFFHVPSRARKGGCPLENEPLGTDYETAVARAETVLLPAFDAWHTGGASEAPMLAVAAVGTLDWMFAEYRTDSATPSWTARPSATMRTASSWSAVTSSRMAAASAKSVSPRSRNATTALTIVPQGGHRGASASYFRLQLVQKTSQTYRPTNPAPADYSLSVVRRRWQRTQCLRQ